MNRGLLLVGAAGLILVLTCLSRPARTGRTRAHLHGGAATPTSSASTRIWPGGRRTEAVRLFPFPPGRITQAARLACAFTAAYTTHRYNQTPEEYVHRLAPMMTPQLRVVIERAAADPAELNQRQRTQEVSVGMARTEAIRTLGPGSIIFLIAATTRITTAYAARTEAAHYAVTLTSITAGPANGDSGWLVYDIEPARAGQAGDTGDTVGGTP